MDDLTNGKTWLQKEVIGGGLEEGKEMNGGMGVVI